MDQVFELSASIVLNTDAFVSALQAAEQRAQAMQQVLRRTADASAAAMQRLQGSAAQSWQSIAAGIASATAALHAFASAQAALGGAPASPAPGFATGLDYVPHDNFTARLHQGEAVLTKLEAEAWRRGGTPAPGIDYGLMADAMLTAFAGVSLQMDSQVVGGLVSPTVSRRIARETRKRRYTTT